MRAQAKAQDALDIEVDRHAMWTAPTESERTELPRHIYDLRCAIAKHLTRFDGRPYSEFILQFCLSAYHTTITPASRTPAWTIGNIIIEGRQLMARLQKMEDTCQPANRRLYRQERAAIEGLIQAFVDALVPD